ncbi:MAG: bifunctional hydroxymethylpyrimidine kinase/phosphomethylpyrimidine kinase [Acidobacteria bacterium]|nr:bifunctional hydroxymethylpyrimidine kinase/phosphomethylpyrimidine kinase [Acidobacteriota bacterium]
MVAVALTIAGSDPSGGAGIQADLKTFHQLGVYGMAVLTLVTVQNTKRVSAVEVLDPRLVAAQLDAVLEDIQPAAAKTGALGSTGVVRVIAERAADFTFPLVVDPVMISKHGAPLIAADACDVLRSSLLPRAALVTPNLHEAGTLADFEVRDLRSMEEAARRIVGLGARAALVKGGHLADKAVDVLCWEGGIQHFVADRIDTIHTHGTGCTYSASIAAELAKGHALPAAVDLAKRFITAAIRSAPGLGGGAGPVNHHALAVLPADSGGNP